MEQRIVNLLIRTLLEPRILGLGHLRSVICVVDRFERKHTRFVLTGPIPIRETEGLRSFCVSRLVRIIFGNACNEVLDVFIQNGLNIVSYLF